MPVDDADGAAVNSAGMRISADGAAGLTGAGLTGSAVVGTRADGAGGTCVHTLRGDGPIALREAAGAVHLVGAAAGPIGGDRLSLRCEVSTGSVLRLRSSASALLLPGAGGEWSSFTLDAEVGSGALLDHGVEPMVAAAGCRHRQRTVVSMADGASLRWREEIVLGRHGEAPGECVLSLDVTYGGVPLLRHELAIGDGHTSPAILGSARAVGSVLLAGPSWAADADGDPAGGAAGRAAGGVAGGAACGVACGMAGSAARVGLPYAEPGLVITPLAGPGVLVLALADGAAPLRRALDAAEARLAATPPAADLPPLTRRHPTSR